MSKFDPSPKAKIRMHEIISKFQAGDLSAVREVTMISLPEGAPAATWTIKNKLMAVMQCGSLDCRTAAHWKRIGRYPKKGSRAIYIVEPFHCWAKAPDGSWEMEVGRDGVEQHKISFTKFLLKPRFAYSATDGEPVEHYDHYENSPPPLMDVAAALGIEVSYDTGILYAGTASVDGEQIQLFSECPAVFFHELAHAVHTKLGYIKVGDDQTAERETVAEFAACVLAAIYGRDDLTGNSWKYISQYNEDPIKAVRKALGQVQQIIGFIEGVARGETIGEATSN